MIMRYLPGAEQVSRMSTDELRSAFMVDDLFQADQLTLHAIDLDRVIVGSAVPGARPIQLEAPAAIAASYFTERRELGVLSIGGAGRVTVDGEVFTMTVRDGLYIGRGTRDITFESSDAREPAKFYLVSYPAHAAFPTRHVAAAQAEAAELGTQANANQRSLAKYFHPGAHPTAQLLMGVTSLHTGSVWNTMPPHTHERRTEVYLYFDLPDDAVVFHMMGRPHETRSLLVRNGQAVLSPSWSIHAGCGTASYRFCWAMGGENQDFSDMQGVAMKELR
jgi:4-deoxy-L-threo-5-hexosulose-uronate ketol-isomerase